MGTMSAVGMRMVMNMAMHTKDIHTANTPTNMPISTPANMSTNKSATIIERVGMSANALANAIAARMGQSRH
jgi:hypothetical protein